MTTVLKGPVQETMPVRRGCRADADGIHRLINENLEAGHLLPRALEELAVHAERFLVATCGDRLAGCGELAPLGSDVAEVRSLVVDDGYRRAGIGSRIVQELRRRARLDGYSRLCAFTHDPTHFVRLGFSIVPHVWLPEKIATDCRGCPWFRRCGQFAMLCSLDAPAFAPRPIHYASPIRETAAPAALVSERSSPRAAGL